MSKKQVSKISDKLSKVSDSFTVNVYDNGYMLEINGRNHLEDWAQAKVIVTSLEDLVTLIKEVTELERD
jgi:hypothetical protein